MENQDLHVHKKLSTARVHRARPKHHGSFYKEYTPARIIQLSDQEFRAAYSMLYAQPDIGSPRWTEIWHAVCERVHMPKRKALVSALKKRFKQYDEIHDIGCGSGHVCELIRQAGYAGALIGVDRSISKRLKKRSGQYRIKVVKADFRDYILPNDNARRAIIDFSAWHFASHRELARMIVNTHGVDYYVAEAFREHPENQTLNKRVKKLTHGTLGVISEPALDCMFIRNGYTPVQIKVFPKDALGRILTLKMYLRRKTSSRTPHMKLKGFGMFKALSKFTREEYARY